MCLRVSQTKYTVKVFKENNTIKIKNKNPIPAFKAEQNTSVLNLPESYEIVFFDAYVKFNIRVYFYMYIKLWDSSSQSRCKCPEITNASQGMFLRNYS